MNVPGIGDVPVWSGIQNISFKFCQTFCVTVGSSLRSKESKVIPDFAQLQIT